MALPVIDLTGLPSVPVGLDPAIRAYLIELRAAVEVALNQLSEQILFERIERTGNVP